MDGMNQVPVQQPVNHGHRKASVKLAMPGKKVLYAVKGLAAIAIIVGVVFVLWWHYHPAKPDASESQAVNTSEYQSVFLTNGQVYFGKLTVVNPDYLKLTDIYYLQVQQSVQPASKSSSSSSNNNVQLVKLGNELHGPEDSMQINRQQVLFWENLKASGKVAQAINQYQNSNK